MLKYNSKDFKKWLISTIFKRKIDQLSDSFKKELKDKQSKAGDLLKDPRLNDLFKSVKDLPIWI